MSLRVTSPYDSIADVYDAAFDEHNAYYTHIESCERTVFDRWIRPSDGHRALDIGCGTGLHSRWLAEMGYQVLGIDPSGGMLDRARRNCRSLGTLVEFAQVDAESVGSLPHRFSVITCLGSTLNHVSDWNGFFREVAGKLAPGGMLLFNFDNIAGLDALFWLAKSGRHVYPQEERLGTVWRRICNAMLGRRFENHWTMDVFGRTAELSLTYDSLSAVTAQLAEAGLRRTEVRGTHLLTVLSSTIMEQAAFVEANDEKLTLRLAHRGLLSIDRIAGRIAPGLASNIVVAACDPAERAARMR